MTVGLWKTRMPHRKRLRANASLAVLAASLCLAPSHSQPTAAPDTVTNPLAGDLAALTTGQVLYRQTCQSCHGEGANGDRGPALNSGEFEHGGTDADLFHTITTGVPGTEMPAFARLKANSIWQIIAYLRSLNGKTGAPDEAVPGDPAAGERVFWDKARCGACHEVNGRGGVVGPDLSAAGTDAAAYLHDTILNPNAPPGQGGGSATRGMEVVKTRRGEEIRGVLRAEDSYALILTDLNGMVHRFDKRDLLEEHLEPVSAMPADYGQKLSQDEIRDLIAYLKTLRRRDLDKTIRADLPDLLSFKRLRNAEAEPGNWLTYWGNYNGHHFSTLNQIGIGNVGRLQAQWAVQVPGNSAMEATPLVVDGVMYTTGQPGQVFAIDAKSGLILWKYERQQKVVNPYEGNIANRGVAMLGGRLFFGTLDAALVALDARTGRLLWETQVANTLEGYSITVAPLVVEDKVIVGVSGGEYGIRGFIDAYDSATGKQVWRFNTVPGPGESGHETWSGDSWQHGGAPAWLTGSYDPELNLLYWAVGNPSPEFNGAVRTGDDLFSCSVVALDPATGKLKWYYQFTPGDSHDWDATEDLVLADRVENGRVQHLMMQANRNGMFYVLDRTNGKFLFAKPFIRETWNNGIGKDGRPIFVPGSESSPEGKVVYPSPGGGTNWQSPSYDPVHRTLYVATLDSGFSYRSAQVDYEAGRQYLGGGPTQLKTPDEINILAIDTLTGNIKWKFPLRNWSMGAGVLATSGGLVFVSTAEGNLIALDQQSGRSLWHFQTGNSITSSPISYSVDGKQFIAVSAGNVLYSFALPD